MPSRSGEICVRIVQGRIVHYNRRIIRHINTRAFFPLSSAPLRPRPLFGDFETIRWEENGEGITGTTIAEIRGACSVNERLAERLMAEDWIFFDGYANVPQQPDLDVACDWTDLVLCDNW